MRIVYAAIKTVFIGATLVLVLLYRKGTMLFDMQAISTLKKIIWPGYIVLCGVMLGYVVYHSQSQEDHAGTGLTSFFIGCGLGVAGALVWIFTQ